MDLARARYLVSSAGRQALASLPAGYETLAPTVLATRLRAIHPPDEAAALAEQVTLRARARQRGISGFLLAAAGLEMMTHPLVAERRARRLAAFGLPVADLTCGLGGDLRAIAAHTPALGLDRDAATALLARANVPAATIVCGDARRPPLELRRFAVLLDPSRRENGRMRDEQSPSPGEVAEITGQAAASVVKLRPGIPHEAIPPGAEVEWVQAGRTLREASAWHGPGSVAGLRRAVLLPAEASLDSSEPECPPEPVPLGSYLLDPESCVTRAGLVRQLGARLGARLLDPQVAYLTAERPVRTPLSATFRVVERLRWSPRALIDFLRTHGLAPDEIRRRAFPVEPDELRRLLGKLQGEPVALLCTTLGGQRQVIIARRVDGGAAKVDRQ